MKCIGSCLAAAMLVPRRHLHAEDIDASEDIDGLRSGRRRHPTRSLQRTAYYQTTRNHPNARTYRTHRSEHALSIHPKPPNRVAIQARINSCHVKSTLMQVDHRRLQNFVLPGNEMICARHAGGESEKCMHKHHDSFRTGHQHRESTFHAGCNRTLFAPDITCDGTVLY